MEIDLLKQYCPKGNPIIRVSGTEWRGNPNVFRDKYARRGVPKGDGEDRKKLGWGELLKFSEI